jgi:hypothetical protein
LRSREVGWLPTPGPCHARRSGFDLHAGVVGPARDRARFERCAGTRSVHRWPDRIRLTETGHVLLELRHRWARRHDAPVVRSARAAGTARRALRDQSGLVLGRAGRPCRPATPTACTRRARDHTPVDRTMRIHQRTPASQTLRRPRGSDMLWAQLMARSFPPSPGSTRAGLRRDSPSFHLRTACYGGRVARRRGRRTGVPANAAVSSA